MFGKNKNKKAKEPVKEEEEEEPPREPTPPPREPTPPPREPTPPPREPTPPPAPPPPPPVKERPRQSFTALSASLGPLVDGVEEEPPPPERYAGGGPRGRGDWSMMSIEEALQSVERSIHDYHGVQLTRWTENQKRVLQDAAELDTEALVAQRSLIDDTLRILREDLRKHQAAREAQQYELQEALEASEDDFLGQIRVLGDMQSEASKQAIDEAVGVVEANAERWVDAEWDHFDEALRQIVWRHAKQVQGAGMAQNVAQLLQLGDLQRHLEAERQGWAESQAQDLHLLQSEISKEHEQIFKDLVNKLKDLSPHGLLHQQRADEIRQLVKNDRQRLVDYEKEVRSLYEAQIQAALVQAEEDYRAFDAQLQAVLWRTLRKRFSDASHMRQLKLALCRWRLDYQRIFHDTCTQLSGPGYAGTPPPAPPPGRTHLQHTEKQLETVRALVLDLWAKNNTPNSEIQRFLDKVMDAVVKDGRAEPLVQVYRAELKQYGALPLLERTDRADLMDCYVESLRAATLTKSPSSLEH